MRLTTAKTAELKVPYELKVYHREKTAFAPPELAKIHPLGKSPVITVIPPASAGPDVEPQVLAESGFISEYLCDHWGRNSPLIPKKWKDGQDGAVGGETAAWLRYQYLMYYAEGSLMPFLVFFLVTSSKLTQVDATPNELMHLLTSQTSEGLRCPGSSGPYLAPSPTRSTASSSCPTCARTSSCSSRT